MNKLTWGLSNNEADKQGRFEDIKDINYCCLNTRKRATEQLKYKSSYANFSVMYLFVRDSSICIGQVALLVLRRFNDWQTGC